MLADHAQATHRHMGRRWTEPLQMLAELANGLVWTLVPAEGCHSTTGRKQAEKKPGKREHLEMQKQETATD